MIFRSLGVYGRKKSGLLGGFVPTDVANTVYWVDAKGLRTGQTNSYGTLDGSDFCSSLIDLSGTGQDLAQGTGSNQPKFTDFKTLVFDGSGDNMSYNVSNWNRASSGTFFLAFKFDSANVNYIFYASDNATNDQYFGFQVLNTGVFRITARGAGSNNIGTCDTTTLTNGNYYVATIQSDGVNWSAWINGVSQTISVSGSDGAWLDQPNDTDNIAMGAAIRNSPLYGVGGTSSVVYNTTVLSAENRQLIEDFLTNRYL